MEFCSRVIYMRQKIMLDYTNLRIVLINRTKNILTHYKEILGCSVVAEIARHIKAKQALQLQFAVRITTIMGGNDEKFS